MQKPFSVKNTRQEIMENLQEKRVAKTAGSSREENHSRGDAMLELVRQATQNLDLFKFNDMTDHDIDVSPATIFEELNNFNSDYFDSKLKIESNLEKKHIRMTMDDLDVKVKFFQLTSEDSEDEDSEQPISRLRMRFVKKRGDIAEWYDLFNQMKQTVLDDILLATEAHHSELATCESDE